MWDKRADMLVHEQEPYNAEAPAAALHTPITPVDSFFVRSHGAVPDVDPTTWRLQVDGLVDTPLSLSLADLRTYDEVGVTATMQCAGNRRRGYFQVKEIAGEAPWGPGATSTARWTGVRLRDVLARAGVRQEARYVAFAGADLAPEVQPPQIFGASVPIAKATSPEVLLAWGMNDAPLPPVHGAPVRVVVPGYIGARSVKWVDRITVQDQPSDNFFQARTYRLLPADADPKQAGPGVGLSLSSIAMNAAILSPAEDAELAAGSIEVKGYAYAGDDRTVVRVDVSSDDGHTWRQADLDPAASPWAWQQWRIAVDLPPGAHTVIARAWDSTGACQPESPLHLWNPKGYVNNSWPRVRVRAS